MRRQKFSLLDSYACRSRAYVFSQSVIHGLSLGFITSSNATAIVLKIRLKFINSA